MFFSALKAGTIKKKIKPGTVLCTEKSQGFGVLHRLGKTLCIVKYDVVNFTF